jgi:peptidoglycan/LPS O-acetylase OafA/YrhL
MAEGARHQPEIDGLRALAIVLVVAFHAGVPGLRGGYCGVDVFLCCRAF